jgi:hypothetical protein
MEVVRDNALHAVGLLEADLGGAGADEREQLLFRLPTFHRKAGIAALLSEADVPELRRCLARSAQARIELLRLPARLGRAPGRFQCASHTGPLFDALVAAEDGLAKEIATLSPQRWLEGEEIEEDFYWAAYLHALVRSGPASSEARDALSPFARAAGGEGTRLGVARALVARRRDLFEASMKELLLEREAEIAELEKGPVIDPERHAVERYVFVEGLALAWLGEAADLPLPAALPMMPEPARRRR